MKLLATITEQDCNPTAPVIDSSDFSRRASTRAVVLDAAGRVALLHVTKRGFHKLPGGGLEGDEDVMSALARELVEEIGCTVEVKQEVGQVIEYRDEWREIQTSDCYIAYQTGQQQPPALTDEEQADGFEAMWAHNLDDAIAMLEGDNPKEYGGQRMRWRDIIILRAAKALIG